MKEYSKVIFETDEKDYFTLWYTDINSGFVKETDHIVCFKEEEVFDAYCKAKGIVYKETMIFNLPDLLSFAIGRTDEADPTLMLNFWNICSDLSFTLGVEFTGDDDNETISELYDTLFFFQEAEDDGELKELTPDDIADLREIVTEGCKLIVANLNAI